MPTFGGVVRLSLEEPYNFLRRHGYVYILRGLRRIGRCRIYYHNKKVALGYVYHIGVVVLSKGEYSINGVKLEHYLSHSGFGSLDDWINEARQTNGLRSFHLYRLEVFRWLI